MAQERTVLYKGSAICYVLEEKAVKNLNLRIHKDCKVYVSASPDIPVEKVDDFVISKGNYIQYTALLSKVFFRSLQSGISIVRKS